MPLKAFSALLPNTTRQWLQTFLLAILITPTFALSPKPSTGKSITVADVLSLIGLPRWQWFVAFPTVLLFLLLTRKIPRTLPSSLVIPLSIFLGMTFTVGKFLYYTGQISWIGSPYPLPGLQSIKFIFTLLGASLIYIRIIHTVHYLIHSNASFSSLSHRFPRLAQFYREKHFRFVFFLMLIVWLPSLIIHYPSGIYFDVHNELEQAFGYIELNSGHPITHIALLYFFVSLGNLLGSANVGIFLFSLSLYVLYALVVAYTSLTLRYLKALSWGSPLLLLFFSISPIVHASIGDPQKDIPYTFAFLLFVVLWARLLYNPPAFFNTKRETLLLVIATSGVILLRKNGLHVIVLVFILTLLFFWIKKIPKKKTLTILCTLSLAIPLAIDAGEKHIANPAPGRPGEMFAVPLQQSSLLVLTHPEKVTPEEEKILRQVLPWDTLDYNPYSIDDAKGIAPFPNGLENDYLKVWLAEGKRAPLTYIVAYVYQNIPLVYPVTTWATYYVHATDDWDPRYIHTQFFNDPQLLVPIKDAYKDFLRLTQFFPFVAFATILTLLLTAFALWRRNTQALLLILPSLLSILVASLSPGVLHFPRYAYPFMLSLPFLVAAWNSFDNTDY